MKYTYTDILKLTEDEDWFFTPSSIVKKWEIKFKSIKAKKIYGYVLSRTSNNRLIGKKIGKFFIVGWISIPYFQLDYNKKFNKDFEKYYKKPIVICGYLSPTFSSLEVLMNTNVIKLFSTKKEAKANLKKDFHNEKKSYQLKKAIDCNKIKIYKLEQELNKLNNKD